MPELSRVWVLIAIAGSLAVVAACGSTPTPSPNPMRSATTSPSDLRSSPSADAMATPSPTTSPAIPTQADVFGAVARWMPTYAYIGLPPTVYVLTGASDFDIGFDARRPTLLEPDSRDVISAALGRGHKVVFVDDARPLMPSPQPDVAVSWDWGDGGALVGLSMDPNALLADTPNVVVSVNNGERGTDVLVTVGNDGLGWHVTDVGQPAQWIT